MRLSNQDYQNQSNIQDVFDVEGNPLIPTICNDKLLTRIINSNIVQKILHNPSQVVEGNRIEISCEKLRPDFHEFPIASGILDETTKQFLGNLPVNSQTIQSITINGIVYDKLFQDLDDHKIIYSDDCILGPTKKLRAEFICKQQFRQQIEGFVQSLGDFFVDFLPPPPIPNYSTYPGDLSTDLPPPPSPIMQTHEGTFPVVSGTTKMMKSHSINNNPLFNPSFLSDDLQNMQVYITIIVY